ncbi:hypothetical protein CR513_53981, partial [Mucuna pruriens]
MVSFLKKNRDIFAWTLEDVLEIDPDFLCHRLSIALEARPISQKKRKMGDEKRKAASEETRKLLAANFIQEVCYPTWLGNVVMVRKSNSWWCMCTNYTHMNKACHMDPYPIPSINWLVNGASGYGLLSFMDAYFRYNQICMHLMDEAKTTFITNRGNYYYKVMPFGLKNARATYQRLIDRIFKDHINLDLVVYVDDMVAKSAYGKQHYKVLVRVFDILRRHKLKLKPEKCSFGVQAEKFLGFMLNRRGIEANLDKCEVVINMRIPRSVKELQQLADRIITLAYFLSRSAKKALPALTLASTPVLTKPVEGTLIIDYLSISNEVVTTALGEVTWYQNIKKATLALVIVAQKLRSYFQSNQIIVRTSLPIKKVLRKPDLAGWMVRWAVEFLRKKRTRQSTIDRASNQRVSGAGIVLEGPDEVLIKQSIQFEFKASNN